MQGLRAPFLSPLARGGTVYEVPDTEGKLETGSGAPMGEDPTAPMEAFETWLLHRVAQAVEAGEVSADLLTDESRRTPQRALRPSRAKG